MTYETILELALAIDKMAQRIGHRFVIDPEKLRGYGLTDGQISVLRFQFGPARTDPEGVPPK